MLLGAKYCGNGGMHPEEAELAPSSCWKAGWRTGNGVGATVSPQCCELGCCSKCLSRVL